MRTLAVLGVIGTVLVSLAAAPAPVSAHVNHVEADSQVVADGRIVAETAFIAADGWVVLHTDDGGEPGEPIGHTAISSEGGPKEDVPVPVAEDVWRDWSGNRTVWVTLHRDDGDGTFEPSDDSQLTPFGEPAGTKITVRKAERPARVLVAAFAPQRANDSTVTVRRVSLPSEGYLVVHNDTGDAPGGIVGATPLGMGTHRNVSVDLDDSFFDSRGSQLTLWSVVYTDDGSGTFDEDDHPVRAGDRRVGSQFGVRKSGEALNGMGQTPSPTPSGSLVTTPTPASSSPTSPSPSPTTTPPNATAGDQSPASPADAPGFGVAVVVTAALTLLAAAAARRYRK